MKTKVKRHKRTVDMRTQCWKCNHKFNPDNRLKCPKCQAPIVGVVPSNNSIWGNDYDTAYWRIQRRKHGIRFESTAFTSKGNEPEQFIAEVNSPKLIKTLNSIQKQPILEYYTGWGVKGFNGWGYRPTNKLVGDAEQEWILNVNNKTAILTLVKLDGNKPKTQQNYFQKDIGKVYLPSNIYEIIIFPSGNVIIRRP